MPRPEYGGYPIGEICAKPTPEGEVQKESGPRDGDLNGGHGIQPGSPPLLDSSGLIQWSELRQDSTGVDWIRPSIHSNPSTVKSGTL
jgi:hypothetical protein